MKKIILFMPVMLMTVRISAQCSCGGGSLQGLGSETGQAFLVLPKGQWMAETFGDIRVFAAAENSAHTHTHSHDSSGTSTDTHAQLMRSSQFSAGIRFGVSQRLTLSAMMPFVSLHANPSGANAFGDMTIQASYKIYGTPMFSLAAQAGAEIPTGKQKAVAGETTLSIGSGSFDPFAGLAMLYRHNRWMIRASAMYKYSAEGFDQLQTGHVFNHTASLIYRPGENPDCVSDSLAKKKLNCSLMLVASGDWVQPMFRNSVMLENTGSYLFSPGIGSSFRYGKCTVYGLFSLPVIQNLRGEQSRQQYRIRFGFMYSIH